jgi:hypothetical protein
MTFTRLRGADWVAFLAALGLLFVTAADWYSSQGGRQAREFEQGAPARGEGAELADDAVLGVIALACAASMRAEEKGTEFREMKPAA